MSVIADLYEQYAGMVIGYLINCYHFTHEVAEDMMQDAFVRLIRQEHLLATMTPEKRQHYLMYTVKHLVVDRYRHNAIVYKAVGGIVSDGTPEGRITFAELRDTAPLPSDRLVTAETYREISYALSEDYWEMLCLLAEGYTNPEIGRMLEQKTSTIKMRVSRARQAARMALKERAAA